MRLFHKGLYKEGFRKNMLIGLIFTVVFVAIGVLIPISEANTHMNYLTGKGICDGSYVIYFVLCFVAMAPLLALNTFNFLNKRNSSDFYHSLPHKRETIFITYALSAFTWILIAIIIPSGISLIVASCFSKYLEVNLIAIVYTLLSVAAASFLVFSATALAVCVTGTLFSNITTALLVIFLPRTLLTIFTISIRDLVQIVPNASFGILGDYSYNIPFNFVTGISNYNFSTINESSLSAIIYTIVLGLVYFLIGAIAFKKRKSENAGYSAQNRVIQATIRIAISFLICTIACLTILQARDDISSNLITIITVYVFAVIAYFVYEAISTKSLKTLGKVAPGLLVVVFLNIVFIVGANIAANSILGYEWKTDNIDSISYQAVQNDMYGYYEPSYEDLKLSDIDISDRSVKEIMTQALNEQREAVKKGNNLYNSGDYVESTLKMKMKNGSTKYRTVVLNSKQYEKFIDAFKKGGYTSEKYWSLPETYTSASIDLDSAGSTIDPDASAEIYKILQQEIKENNIEPKDYITHSWLNSSDTQSEMPTATLTLYGSYGTKTYNSLYLISSKTPKTLQAVIDYYTSEDSYNKINKGIDDLIEGQVDYNSEDYIHLNIHEYYTWNYDIMISNNDDIDDDKLTLLKDIKAAIEEQKTKDIDFDKKTFSLSINKYSENDYASYDVLLNVDDELEEKLISASNLYNYGYAY